MRLLIMTLVALLACDSQPDLSVSPTGMQPAAKHNPRAIPDTCYAVVWEFQPDVVYSIFYGDYRFQVEQEQEVWIDHYVEPDRRRSYFNDDKRLHYSPDYDRWAEIDWSDMDVDSLRTDALTDSTRSVVLYAGIVKPIYRSLPGHHQYRVAENDTTYRIAKVRPDSSVVPIEFSYSNRRFHSIVPPPSIGEESYFLPINLDTLAWEDAGRGDVRQHLRPVITEVDCPERPVEAAGASTAGYCYGRSGGGGGGGGGNIVSDDGEVAEAI